MIKRIVLLFFIAGMALGFSIPALAQSATPPSGPGKLTGTVINGTAGAPAVGGMDVTLISSQNGQLGGSFTARADASGKFEFNGLATDSSSGYQLFTTYQGIHYTSEEVAFPAGQATLDVPVKVYETSDDGSKVSVMLAHVVFFQAGNVMQVKEYYLVVNAGDRTYTGSLTGDGKKQTMSLSLPNGATNVKYTDGISELTASPGGDGIVVALPIVPGMNGIGYTYDLPSKSDKLSFTKKIGQNIAQIDILAEGTELKITGEGLTIQEPLNVEGTVYAHASKQGLTPGETISFQISGLSGGQSQNPVLWVVVALAVLAVAAMAVYLLTRRSARPVPAGPPVGPDEERSLLQEMVRLDDEFESGKLPESEYKSARQAIKSRLIGARTQPDTSSANKDSQPKG